MMNIFLRYIKINTRIIISLLSCIIISTMIIMTFLSYATRLLTEKYLAKYVEATQATTGRSVELIVDEAASTLANLLDNLEIMELFDSALTYGQREARLREIIAESVNSHGIISNVIIIDTDHRLYDNLLPAAELPYQKTMFAEKARRSIYPIWGSILKGEGGQGHLEYGQQFRNYRNGQVIGELILYIKESAIFNAYHVSNWGESFLLANDNYIISHSDKNKLGNYIYDSSIFQNDKKFSYKHTIIQSIPSITVTYLINDQINWKIVSDISEDKLFGVLRKINKTIFIIEMPILFLIIVISTMISLQITKSLSALKKRIDSAQIEDVPTLALLGKNDEIGALEVSYNNLLRRIRELIDKNNLEKERQRELELIALQAQINPHFIYNTLDAIAWIAKLKQQADIERLVMALATFFRISLHHGDKYITVADEITLIKSFVAIEQVRFPGKFQVTYEIEETILACEILKIIIQPIVENAIKHGIGRKNGSGAILVSGRREGDLLRFQVADDGVGIDLGQNGIDQLPHTIAHSGYGLRNVDERIRLEYGPPCGIEFHSEKDRGTRVTITVKVFEGECHD